MNFTKLLFSILLILFSMKLASAGKGYNGCDCVCPASNDLTQLAARTDSLSLAHISGIIISDKPASHVNILTVKVKDVCMVPTYLKNLLVRGTEIEIYTSRYETSCIDYTKGLPEISSFLFIPLKIGDRIIGVASGCEPNECVEPDGCDDRKKNPYCVVTHGVGRDERLTECDVEKYEKYPNVKLCRGACQPYCHKNKAYYCDDVPCVGSCNGVCKPHCSYFVAVEDDDDDDEIVIV